MRSRAMADETTTLEAEGPLYDRDFALWAEAQVAALRAGDVAALDVENLVEELEGLTRRDERALGSQLKRIMARMLKQRHQPARATRSWRDSIRNGREQIEDILDHSPSLRRLLPALLSRTYPRAVAQAASGTRLPATTFPPELSLHPRRGPRRGLRPRASALVRRAPAPSRIPPPTGRGTIDHSRELC